MRYSLRVLFVLSVFGCAEFTQAADVITWGTPTNITGDSDVVTTGALVYAYNVGPDTVQATTVNGVDFAAWAFPNNFVTNTSTIDSVTFTENIGSLISSDVLGTVTGDFASLSSSYQALLGTGGGADVQETLSLTLGGLTIGKDYIFQWWINNSSETVTPNNGLPWLLTTASVGANAVNLNGNVGNGTGNLGQYVTGTFTAAATSKIINFDGTSGFNRPLVNAFQLRVVPEPSTWVMGGLATSLLAGSGLRMRRQKKN